VNKVWTAGIMWRQTGKDCKICRKSGKSGQFWRMFRPKNCCSQKTKQRGQRSCGIERLNVKSLETTVMTFVETARDWRLPVTLQLKESAGSCFLLC